MKGRATRGVRGEPNCGTGFRLIDPHQAAMHVVGFDFTSEKLGEAVRRSAHPREHRIVGEGIAQNFADSNPVLRVGLTNRGLGGRVCFHF